MKRLLLALLPLLPATAFASHPHDRVCVGSAPIGGQDAVAFVLQWEIGRTYEQGDPNKDNHEVTLEATSSYGDYLDADTIRYESGKVILKGGDTSLALPVVLRDAKGVVFFDGKFSWKGQETLTGKINKGPGKNENDKEQFANVVVKLSCVSQPRLTLQPAQE